MNICNEILSKLAVRTIEYYNNDLGMSEIKSDYSVEDVDHINYLDISTLISFSRDLSGTIGMSVSSGLARKMVENFVFGNMDEDTIEELASENVAETLNVTLGNILQDIAVVKEGGKVEISTPYTMHNSVVITKKKDGHMCLCKLKYGEDEEIYLSYFI